MWNAPLPATEHVHNFIPSPTAHDRPGAPHRVLRQLGQSELTRAYLALRAGEHTLVRLELLRKELAHDADVRELFLDRAIATRALRHPKLASTRDVVAEAGTVGRCVEFVDGQPLARVLERIGRSELPLTLHLRVLCDVLEALHHAHAGGSPGAEPLVHGDISPAEVLITYDGIVKVSGAGFARVRHAVEQRLGAPRRDVGYRAPELFLGYEASAAADVYGVGVMLWEAIAQCRRSLALDASSVAKQRTRGEEPDIDEVSTGAPKRLRSICRRALAVSRCDRHASALSFKTELESFLDEVGAPSADAASAQLAGLLRGRFDEERQEMQLFIDTAVPPRRPLPPASVQAKSKRGAAQTESPSAPQKSSDSGEHRAFSTSLVPAPAVRPRSPKVAWWLAAAGLALVTGVTARWVERSVSEPSAALRTLRSEAANTAPPAAPDYATLDQPRQTTAHADEPTPLTATAPQPVATAGDDAGPGPSLPPPAFLALPGGDLAPETMAYEAPAVRADDLPTLDGERARLQDTLVNAARRYRARLARKEAERRAALREAAEAARAAAAAPPAPSIVERNPYDP